MIPLFGVQHVSRRGSPCSRYKTDRSRSFSGACAAERVVLRRNSLKERLPLPLSQPRKQSTRREGPIWLAIIKGDATTLDNDEHDPGGGNFECIE
jgi:hypothetical protein